MKKIFNMALVALAASVLSAATLQTVAFPASGDKIALKNAGKIVSVDAFSTNQVGTVDLKRVYGRTVSTNQFDASGVVTNTVVVYQLSLTNTVLNGSCSNGFFHGAPASDCWVYPRDWLIFTGTATGGELRIIVE